VAESVARIKASLRGFARREQRNLLLQAGLAAFAAWCLAWALLAAAVSSDVASSAEGWIWLGGLALAGVVAGAIPLRELRAARDARRQALRVEALRPELQGALLTVLDRETRPPGSPSLLARLAARAAAAVDSVAPALVHPAATVRRVAGLAVASALLLGIAGLVLPRGPIEALAALSAPDAVAEIAEDLPEADGPRALLGDITLRYLYPTYTGREPFEVPNSNGEVHAPPGTVVEVRARTGEPQETASLVVYERAPAAAELVEGRSVRGSFTVEGPGAWRFVFGELPSPDYAIVPDPDLAPDVSVQTKQRVLSLALDGEISLPWTARDDFGLTRVVVEVDEGGKKREVEVRAPVDVPRVLDGVLSVTPASLGLAAGASAKLRVGAWDNDAVSGKKAGYSSVIEIEVLGPRGRADRQAKYRKLLRDALVLVLADFLLDPAPPGILGAEASTWATAAAARYEPFDRLVQEAWGGAEPDTFDATLLRALRDDRRGLLSFASGLGGTARIADRDLAMLVSLQGKHVETVENGILMLDQVIRAAALATLEELVVQAAKEAQELKSDFQTLDKPAALARLDQLERLYQQLARESAKLDDGALRDFVNSRSAQVDSLMDEIRKAIREGRMDDAKELMDRLAETMQEMADQISDMQQQRQKSGEDLQKAMEQVKTELEALEKDQSALRERTESAREEHGDDMQEAVDRWKEVERLAGVVVEQLGKLDPELEPFRATAWSGGSVLGEVRGDAAGLHDSARGRDLDTALLRADQMYGSLGMLGGRVSAAIRRQKGDPTALAVSARAVEAQQKNIQKIREFLDEMAQRQAQTSPALQRELQQMAEEQQQIAERAKGTAEKAGKVAENLPMDAPGLEEGTRRGAEQAGRAAKAMRDGEPMPAEGGQRAAEDAFREAQDALDEASRNLRQMQQASQGQGKGEREEGKEDGEGDKPGDGEDMLSQDMALPAPEAFRTPEEYRRALLQGMEGEVPEEYKTLNRRYYEELVRQ
jgi:methyl-accepting chemotaxis protein